MQKTAEMNEICEVQSTVEMNYVDNIELII